MPLKTPPVLYDLIKLAGGLDQVTPTLSLPPGVCRRAANFECSITGGYTRITGYERFDGRPSPSDALYNILTCSLTGSVVVGNTVTGLSSAATGKVIARNGNDVVITRQTGTFVTGENISVSAVNVGSITELVGVSGDGATDATYKGLAADDYRADIAAVPGSGSILGVILYNDFVYAWRNNAGGTAAELYKSSSSGWVKINFGKELSFNTGTAQISNGNTVTGAVSGATGVVARVVKQSGTWGGSPSAAGRLILSSTTGTFQVGELLQVGGVSKATSGGAATQITYSPSGRFEMVIGNFGGGVNNKKIYGCDGVNRGFEFDGTTFVPLATGMTTDTPVHVAFHKQRLWFSFGPSIQYSSLGDPYAWVVISGAGEFVMNDNVTNLLVMPGDQSTGALGIFTRTDTSILYGTDTSNFNLSTFNTGAGGIAYTAQNMDQAYVLDDRGVISLHATLNYGNFDSASLTMTLKPFLDAHRNYASASCLQRVKGQYRVFFSDGYGLYITVRNGELLGSMPVQYTNPVLCTVEDNKSDGTNVMFFGSSNGFVYQMDKGTSFDGNAIPANINLVYNSEGSPRVLKRFRKASVEMTGDSYAQIAFGYDLAYRSTALSQPSDASYANDLRQAYWDSMTWDNFVWDGSDITPTEIEVDGTAENMAIRISSVSALLQPFTVNNIIVHYTPRRGLR